MMILVLLAALNVRVSVRVARFFFTRSWLLHSSFVVLAPPLLLASFWAGLRSRNGSWAPVRRDGIVVTCNIHSGIQFGVHTSPAIRQLRLVADVFNL